MEYEARERFFFFCFCDLTRPLPFFLLLNILVYCAVSKLLFKSCDNDYDEANKELVEGIVEVTGYNP